MFLGLKRVCFRIEQFCFKSIQVNGIANCFSMSNFFSKKVISFQKKNSNFGLTVLFTKFQDYDCFALRFSEMIDFFRTVFFLLLSFLSSSSLNIVYQLHFVNFDVMWCLHKLIEISSDFLQFFCVNCLNVVLILFLKFFHFDHSV